MPEHDRYGVLAPAQYYLAAQTVELINKDWGGQGTYADGKIVKIAGIPLVKSNNVPKTVVSAETGENNTYSGDFTNTVAAIFQKQAIGTVKLMDLALQVTGDDFKAMYQGTMLVAKMAVGHGYLRPECSVELSKAAA